MTWAQRYGTKKSNEMKAKRTANRKKPKPLTTFMRHNHLRHPLTEDEADGAALDIMQRFTGKVTRFRSRGPYK